MQRNFPVLSDSGTHLVAKMQYWVPFEIHADIYNEQTDTIHNI